MASAIRDINKHEEDMAELIRECIGESDKTWSDVSFALGKSERTVRYYGECGNLNASNNRLKAHEIKFLPEPLKSVITKFIIEEAETHTLNGTMDDEWAEMSQLFGSIRADFNDGRKYSRLKEDKFRKMCLKMFAEWRAKDEGEI